MTGTDITIQNFSERYGAKTLFARWMLEKDISDFLGMQITGGVILADALIGDGMRDHISPELLSAFHSLMGAKAETADQVRDLLLEKLSSGDASVLGLINKIKGQVGENMFMEGASMGGFSARLADAGNQEAWDCCISNSDGVAQYIQVKTYASADAVVAKMREVGEKVAAGKITDRGEVVEQIGFAVPQDIHAEVVAKAAAAGLADTPVISFDLSAQDAARVVQDGFDNVAYHGFGNFFSEFAGSALTGVALIMVVQGFLLYKGSSNNTIKAVAQEAGIAAGGIGAALAAEGIIAKGGLAVGSLPAALLLVTVGLTTRGLLRRVIARHDYEGFLKQENTLFHQKIRLLSAPVS